MAIAVDAVSPARATANAGSSGVATTASFNAPADCVILACAGCDTTAPPSVTITNNGAALSWSLIKRRNNASSGGLSGGAEAHYAVPSGARSGLTVTATLNSSNDMSLKVYVVTGAGTLEVVGNTAEGSSTATGNFVTTGLTTVKANSMGFWVANDFSARGTPTSSDSIEDGYGLEPEISGGAGYRALTGGAGASETFSITSPGGSASTWNYIMFEIREPLVADSVRVPIRALRVP